MKRIVGFLPAFFLGASLVLFAPSFAISGNNNSHPKTTMKNAMFNPSTIETVKGKVADVTTPKAKKGMTAEERLSLKTDHGTMPVILGPASYINKENVKINKGDDVSVTGSRVTMHKKNEIVATEVKDGSKTLDLRKSDGTPLWSANASQGK